MADEWQIVGIEDDHCVATCKNIGISIWRRATTRAGLELSLRAYTDLVRLRPSGLGWFVIVERTAMPPDDEVRKLVLDAMSKMVEIKALAAVHEGEGFQVATHRAVAASLSTPGKIQFPRRVFGSIEEAANWLSGELRIRRAPPFARDELIRSLTAIRQMLVPSARQREKVPESKRDPIPDMQASSVWGDAPDLRRNRP